MYNLTLVHLFDFIVRIANWCTEVDSVKNVNTQKAKDMQEKCII